MKSQKTKGLMLSMIMVIVSGLALIFSLVVSFAWIFSSSQNNSGGMKMDIDNSNSVSFGNEVIVDRTSNGTRTTYYIGDNGILYRTVNGETEYFDLYGIYPGEELTITLSFHGFTDDKAWYRIYFSDFDCGTIGDNDITSGWFTIEDPSSGNAYNHNVLGVYRCRADYYVIDGVKTKIDDEYRWLSTYDITKDDDADTSRFAIFDLDIANALSNEVFFTFSVQMSLEQYSNVFNGHSYNLLSQSTFAIGSITIEAEEVK